VDSLNKSEENVSGSGFVVEQDVRNGYNVKLAMDIMRCHFSAFNQDTTNNSTSSGLTDWILLALSPMGKFIKIHCDFVLK
jgi:hypothetical protein